MPTQGPPEPPEMAPAVGGLSREALERAYLSLRGEYNTTVLVVAILAERVLSLTKASHVVISDEALLAGPNLNAWRDDSKRQVMITVER